MTAELRLELERLLSALCDEQLGEEEFARLEALLSADAECRRLYLEYLDMHASLLIEPRLVDRQAEAAATEPSTVAGKAAQPSRRRGLQWGAENVRHGLLVAGTLAASLLVQLFWLPPLFAPRTPQPAQPDAVVVQAPNNKNYVATLVKAVDCQWESPRNPGGDGARLAPGRFRLPKGIASIRFDAGPELILQGPAEINLDSASSVTVLSGKIVFRTSDSDVPFDLRTPTSTLVDAGGECAVAVSPEAEEVYVFDGELQRVSKKTVEPESLKAGESRRYENETGLPVKPALDAAQFVRFVDDPAKARLDPSAGLLAYEGFAYNSPLALQNGTGTGGTGWAGPWRMSVVRPGFKAEQRDRLSLNAKESLLRADSATPSVGGSFEYAGYAKSFRKLKQPVALDADAVYYLSFLFRRQPPADSYSTLAIVLWSDDDYQQQNFLDFRKRLYLGVKGSNQLDTHLGRMTANASLPLSDGTTYLMVAKIAAGRSKPDQVFLRVYGPDEAVMPEEDGHWSVKSQPFRSDLVFDWVELHVSGKGRQAIDEIRLGTTWASVTAPWIGAKQKGG